MSVRFIPLANINGKGGERGPQGPAGTFASASGHTLPAGENATVETSGPETAKHLEIGVPRGLPGTNALANDEAFATYIAATDTETRAALEGVFIQKDTLVFNTADHGVAGDGVTDDTASMQALIGAVPAGSTIVAPPGSTFRTDGWVVDQKSVSLDLSNAHLVKTATGPIVQATGGFGPVSSAALVNDREVSVVSTEGLAVGDIVKVFANNVIPDARPRNETEKARVGEMVVVESISGSTVRVNPPLRDEYSDNVRVAKLLDIPFALRFGTADYQDGVDFSEMFRADGLAFPTVKGRILRGIGSGLGAKSCYGGNFDVEVSNLPSGNGYGVILGGSQKCRVNVHASRTRHAYSDDCSRIAVNDPDPMNYGRAQDNIITGTSFSSWETAFDTHHGSKRNKFLGCISDGVVQNGGAGFSLRGSQHELIGCTASNSTVGFRIMTETSDTWSTSEGHYLGNCVARNVNHAWMFSVGTYVSNVLTATIDGGYFEGYYRSPAYLRNVTLYLNNPTIVYNHPVPPSDNGIVNVGRAELSGSMRIVSTDMSQGVNDSIFNFAGIPSPAARVLLDVELKLADYEMDNTSVLTRVNTAVGKINWTARSSFPIPLIGSPSGGAERFSSTFRGLFGNGAGSSSAVTEMSVSNGDVITFNRSGDAHVTVRCKPTGSGVTIGEIYQAAFDGQLLTIRNSLESNDSFTVPNGTSYNTFLGASVTLAPGESLTLAWVSSLSQPRWERIS